MYWSIAPGLGVDAKFSEGFYNVAKVIISPEHTCHGGSDIISLSMYILVYMSMRQ